MDNDLEPKTLVEERETPVEEREKRTLIFSKFILLFFKVNYVSHSYSLFENDNC